MNLKFLKINYMPLYTVPKFTEMETKIAGPLTFKQLVFLLATGGICFLIYATLPRPFSLFLILIVAILGLALAFLKVGEIPFYKVALDSLIFFIRPKTLFWGGKQKTSPFTLREMEIKKEEKQPIKLKRVGKLKEITVKVLTKK